MTAEQAKDRFTRLQEKLAKEPRCTQEEREAFAAERRADEGKWLETVTMLQGGDLQIRTWQCLPGGVLAEGNTESSPGDAGYEDFIQRHGPLKPGQSHTLMHKWIEGEWVLVNDNSADEHKTA